MRSRGKGRIIVDAMGGDNAPLAQVEGGLLAARELEVDVILVGRIAEILGCIEQLGHSELPRGIEVADASQVIEMGEDPTSAIKRKKDSSLVVGLNLLKDGGGDAIVSAGSTGALLAGATLIPKRIRGIRRAAMAPVIPNREGGAVLIDCGANTVCTPEYLLQFAYMGSYYAKRVLGRETPRVGLLNIGTEAEKGGPLQKETFALLTEAGEAGRIQFIGNVEGRDVLLGGADVVVTDGFTGNILLKAVEGTATYLMGELKQAFLRGAGGKLAAVLMKSGLSDLKGKLDASQVGGTALLGISKPVIKAHGNADATAIRNAIRQAKDLVESDIAADIAANMDKIKLEKNETGGVSQ